MLPYQLDTRQLIFWCINYKLYSSQGDAPTTQIKGHCTAYLCYKFYTFPQVTTSALTISKETVLVSTDLYKRYNGMTNVESDAKIVDADIYEEWTAGKNNVAALSHVR